MAGETTGATHAGRGSTGQTTTFTVPHTRVRALSFAVEGHDHVAASGPTGDVFTFTPLEDVEIVAHLDGFARAPANATAAIFAQTPPATGGTPVVSLTASRKSPNEAAFSWRFDPASPQQAPIATLSHIWIRVTADSAAPLLAQVGLATRGLHDLRWETPGAVRRGARVAVSAAAVGFGAQPRAEIKVYDAGRVGPDGTVPADAPVVDTLTATVDRRGHVTATWAQARQPDPPASSGGSGPRPAPSVVFVVTIDGVSAVSPTLVVVPNIRITIRPGDPNWLMERICDHTQAHEDPVDYESESDYTNGMGRWDRDRSARGADAVDRDRYPNRVLGLKQRLQALGYYYEKLPPPPPAATTGAGAGAPAATPPAGSVPPPTGGGAPSAGAAGTGAPPPPPDPNKQTRVFRKCLAWYWKNVFPADNSAVPMVAGALDPNEVPPLGPEIVDVYNARMVDLCRDLEERVRTQIIVQDPDAAGSGSGSGGGSQATVDFTKEVRLVLPGDFHTNNQEVLFHLQNPGAAPAAQTFNLARKRVDYTYRRPLGPTDDPDYANHVGGLSGSRELPPWAFSQIKGLGDFRFMEERAALALNGSLGKIPLVAKLEMQTRDGDDQSWVEGPVEGVRVMFQLAPVPEASGHVPPYLDRLHLRDTTGVTSPRGALPTLPPASRPRPAPGPKGYVAGVHSALHKFPAGDEDSDPTWWNTPVLLGGKRGLGAPAAARLKAVGPRTSWSVLLTGADSTALGVPPEHDFPWSAEDATVAHPAHSARARRAVSVPAHRGRAVVILAPSPVGGDCYRLKVWVDAAAPAASGGAHAAPAPLLGEVTTETMTVWKRVRVTRYFKKDYPADWRTAAASPNSADYTPRDRTNASSPAVSPKDEAGGDLPDIDWTSIAAMYKKAFLVLETPRAHVPLTRELRNKAIQGALKLIDSVVRGHVPRTDPASRIDWARLLRRDSIGDVVNPFPPYDPLSLVRSNSADSPFLIDWNSAAAYDAAQPAGSTPLAGPHPYNKYYHLLARIEDFICAYAGMFLDDAYDPAQHDRYDGVPFPGVSCVQALRADSYVPVIDQHVEPGALAMPPGTPPERAFLAYLPLATGSTALVNLKGTWANPSERRHSVGIHFTNEMRHQIEATLPVAALQTFTIDDLLTAIRAAGALARHADYGADAPLISATLTAESRIAIEIRKTARGGTHTPYFYIDGHGLTPGFGGFEIDATDPTKFRITSARLVDASRPTPIDYDAANPGRAGTLEHDLATLNLNTNVNDLRPGDRIVIRRLRPLDGATGRAKLPPYPEPPAPGRPPYIDDDEANFEQPVWRQIEFIYGRGSASAAAHASTTGTTLRQLNEFIRAQLADGLRGSRTGVTYELKRAGTGGGPDRFFCFRSDPMDSKWQYDGLALKLSIVRPATRAGESDSTNDFLRLERDNLWADLATPPDQTKGEVTTNGASGVAYFTRTFYLFYGADAYDNAGFWGPDPTGRNGRGYMSPGNLNMCYPLAVNAAHELGHTLYLRHHWTGLGIVISNGWNYVARGDENPDEHDDDDLCHMGYWTSFLETSGPERTRGRAEPCGRCLFKLRGWMPLAANAPATRPGAPPAPRRGPAPPLQPPAARRTHITDWWPAPAHTGEPIERPITP